MRKGIRGIVSANLAVLLVACGGGGGGDSGPSGPSPAQGLYFGSTSNGRSAGGVVLSNGSAWILYSAAGNENVVAGLVQGRISADGGTFSLRSARDYNLEGLGVLSVSGDGSYTDQQTLSGTLRYSGSSVTFTTTYDAAYELVPTRSAVEGSYEGNVASTQAQDVIGFDITAAGEIFGSSRTVTCNFTGHLDPRADANAYDLTVTFSNSGECAAPGETVQGIAFLDPDTGQLIGAALLDDRDDGAIFIAHRT